MFYDLQASIGDPDGHRVESTVELVIKAVSFKPATFMIPEPGAVYLPLVPESGRRCQSKWTDSP